MSNAPTGLAAATARGFFWMTLMGLATKAIGFLGQIALAWILLPEHFGLISLAFTVSTFADLVQSYGLREVLVRRRAKLRLWSAPAIWLSLATGLGAGAMLALAAPIAAAAYGKGPVVAHLILILALTSPIQALAIVPDALMQHDLRFRGIAFLMSAQTLGQLFCTILLALLGFGAYSFAVSMLLMAFARTAAAWWLARPRLSNRPRWRRSLRLLRPSLILVASALVMNIMAQGDKFALGLFHPEAVVGAYFFAYNLSLQTAVLLSLNLSRVLFPVLTRLQDEPERLRIAFVRAARVLMFIGAPACFLQAAAAGPLIRGLIQKEHWFDSIRAMQILSIGMTLHLLWNPGRGLIQVQGRYRMYLISAVAYASAYMALVIAASARGGPLAVAWTVAGVLSVNALIDVTLALRPIGGGARDLMRITLAPIAMAAAAILPAWGLEFIVPDMPRAMGFPLREIVLLAGMPLVAAAIYLPLVRALAPDVWEELAHRFGPGMARVPGLARLAARFRIGAGLNPPAP